MDADDSYHLLIAELAPVELQDIPESDPGDLNHPAAIRCNANHGYLYSSQVQSLINKSPQAGPLYTAEQALQLSLLVSSHNLSNWQGARVPVRSHLDVKALAILLDKYPDKWVL